MLESDPAKTGNTGELAHIAGDERSPVGERRGGDEIVVGANGRAFTLKDGLDVAVVVGSRKVKIEGGNQLTGQRLATPNWHPGNRPAKPLES